MELGPRWTTLELRAVFMLLRNIVTATAASGANDIVWADLAAQIPTRTPAMLRALFELQRAYLTQPDASVSGFFATMTSYYDNHTSGTDDTPTAASAEHDVIMEDAEIESTRATTVNISASATRSINTLAMRTVRLNSASSARRAARKRVGSRASTAPAALSPGKWREGDSARARRATGASQLDRRTQLQLQILSADGNETRADAVAVADRIRSPRKTASPRRARAFAADLSSLGREASSSPQQFALPWTHWFCPSVDRAFYDENEFIDCLQRMGLANITRAARPVWSSVRASMGRPRRLSERFFAHEKRKLERTRTAARTRPLAPGTTVLVPLSSFPIEFTIGTVLNCDVRTSACTVAFDQGSSVRAYSIDAVMTLDSKNSSSQSRGDASTIQLSSQQAQTLPTVLQYAGRTLPVPPAAPRSEPTQQQQRHAVSSAILSVRDLLQRKEQLVTALASLNARAARAHHPSAAPAEATCASSISSDSVNGQLPFDTSSNHDRWLLERQCEWIVRNLDATNRSLQHALLQLQQCTHDAQTAASALSDSAAQAPVASHTTAHASVSPADARSATESLSLEHMKWAVQLLAQSRSSASDLVATSVAHMSDHTSPLQREIAPETRELVATSLCLLSVVRRGIASESPRVPPLVTQKLTERLLELLEPRHDANLDVYAELRAAANSVLSTLRS